MNFACTDFWGNKLIFRLCLELFRNVAFWLLYWPSGRCRSVYICTHCKVRWDTKTVFSRKELASDLEKSGIALEEKGRCIEHKKIDGVAVTEDIDGGKEIAKDRFSIVREKRRYITFWNWTVHKHRLFGKFWNFQKFENLSISKLFCGLQEPRCNSTANNNNSNKNNSSLRSIESGSRKDTFSIPALTRKSLLFRLSKYHWKCFSIHSISKTTVYLVCVCVRASNQTKMEGGKRGSARFMNRLYEFIALATSPTLPGCSANTCWTITRKKAEWYKSGEAEHLFGSRKKGWLVKGKV